LGDIGQIALADGQARLRWKFGGIANDGRDLMAAREKFVKDTRTGLAGRAQESDMHVGMELGLYRLGWS
jgi:hypothetical protein